MFRDFTARAGMTAMLLITANATLANPSGTADGKSALPAMEILPDDFRDAFLRSFPDASRKPR